MSLPGAGAKGISVLATASDEQVHSISMKVFFYPTVCKEDTSYRMGYTVTNYFGRAMTDVKLSPISGDTYTFEKLSMFDNYRIYAEETCYSIRQTINQISISIFDEGKRSTVAGRG